MLATRELQRAEMPRTSRHAADPQLVSYLQVLCGELSGRRSRCSTSSGATTSDDRHHPLIV